MMSEEKRASGSAEQKQMRHKMPRKDRQMATAVEEVTATESTEENQPSSNEITTQTDANDATTEKTSKREKVDLATADPLLKVSLNFQIPAELKLKALKAAENANMNVADWARNLVANNLGYTIPDSFIERKRSGEPMTDEERKADAKRKRDAQRDTVKNLVTAVKGGTIDRDMLTKAGFTPEQLAALGL